MRVFSFLNGIFDGVQPAGLAVVALLCLAAEFFLAYKLGKASVFVAAAVTTDGLCFLPALVSPGFSEWDTVIFGVLLATVSAFWCFVLLLILSVRERKRIRREKRAAENRRSVFTLPDRENTFVRDRLNTALRPEPPEEKAGEYDLEDGKLRLDHVRKMLARLKAAELTPGDRLEAEGISRTITLYASKDLLTAKEVHELNDCLAAVLKMTAKYEL